jgi:hypothetical protein
MAAALAAGQGRRVAFFDIIHSFMGYRTCYYHARA